MTEITLAKICPCEWAVRIETIRYENNLIKPVILITGGTENRAAVMEH